MPRTNRHALPGLLWHITHRCHRRRFLLRFSRDRRCWQYWLRESNFDAEMRCLRATPGSYLANSVGTVGPLRPETALHAGSNLF